MVLTRFTKGLHAHTKTLTVTVRFSGIKRSLVYMIFSYLFGESFSTIRISEIRKKSVIFTQFIIKWNPVAAREETCVLS